MKKIKMARGTTLTFSEGCEKYLEYCRQRNLRQGTINHYKQSYDFSILYLNIIFKSPIKRSNEIFYPEPSSAEIPNRIDRRAQQPVTRHGYPHAPYAKSEA